MRSSDHYTSVDRYLFVANCKQGVGIIPASHTSRSAEFTAELTSLEIIGLDSLASWPINIFPFLKKVARE